MSTNNKDVYTFYTNGNNEQVSNVIQNYLVSNNFQMQNTNGVIWHTVNDGMIYRCFEYYMDNEKVVIYIYMNNYNNPASVMNNSYANNYINSLQELFNILSTIGNNRNSTYNQSVVNSFNNTVNTKNEQRATLGFIISIIVILASCLGVTAGVPLIALEVWLASCGLKTSKKKLSIATFIMAGISAIILIVQIFMMIL